MTAKYPSKKHHQNDGVFGAPGETRTPNQLIRSQLLYPLSYGCMVGRLYPSWALSSSDFHLISQLFQRLCHLLAMLALNFDHAIFHRPAAATGLLEFLR
jgi:hypothetical protein